MKEEFKAHESPAMFNDEKVAISLRYIAWIDLMGAANLMQYSLKSGAILIGRLHDVIFTTWKEKPTGLTIHSIVDGCYVVAKEITPLLNFVESVMSRYFACFYEEYKSHRQGGLIWKYCAMVRSAITYGPIYINSEMRKGFECDKKITQDDLSDAYFSNVFVGNLLATTYELEKKAPPFGVYLDSSVICQNLSLPLNKQARFILGQGAWYRWFLNSTTTHTRSKLGIPQNSQEMGETIVQYLDMLKECQYECNYPVGRHEEWRKMVKEYFVNENNCAKC